MQMDTGELRNVKSEAEMLRLKKHLGFEPVPEDLQDQANELLGDQESVIVPKENGLRKEMNRRLKKMSRKAKKRFKK